MKSLFILWLTYACGVAVLIVRKHLSDVVWKTNTKLKFQHELKKLTQLTIFATVIVILTLLIGN